MSQLINSARFLGFSGSSLYVRSIKSYPRFSSIAKREFSGTANPKSSSNLGAPHSSSTPWDVNNRIRVIGATFGIVGVVGMLFDTFYRRATKQELMDGMDGLDAKIDARIDRLDEKIDKEIGKLDAKIDGLTHALLHTNPRDKIAAEIKNRDLEIENQRLRENAFSRP